MRKCWIKKIGKIGRRNIEANRKIRQIFKDKQITSCELKLEGCMNWPLQIVHRHKRVYYRDKVEKLYDFNEVALGCQHCHDIIEPSRQETEKAFKRIR